MNWAPDVKSPSGSTDTLLRGLLHASKMLLECNTCLNVSNKRCHICVSSSSGNQLRNVLTSTPFPLFLLFFHFPAAGTSWGEWCHSYWMFWWLIPATKCSFCSLTFHTLTVWFHVRSAYIKNMKVSAAICFFQTADWSHTVSEEDSGVCVCVCVCVCVYVVHSFGGLWPWFVAEFNVFVAMFTGLKIDSNYSWSGGTPEWSQLFIQAHSLT